MPRIKWSDRARADLREIKKRIAKDTLAGAVAYIKRLKRSADRLERFLLSGWMVEELNDPDIHEIVFDRYRIVYTYDRVVLILRVWPAGRPLIRRGLEHD